MGLSDTVLFQSEVQFNPGLFLFFFNSLHLNIFMSPEVDRIHTFHNASVLKRNYQVPCMILVGLCV